MGEGARVNPKLRFEVDLGLKKRDGPGGPGLVVHEQGPGPDLCGVSGVTAGHSQATPGIRPLLPSADGCSPASLSPWVPMCRVPASLPCLGSQLLLEASVGEALTPPP